MGDRPHSTRDEFLSNAAWDHSGAVMDAPSKIEDFEGLVARLRNPARWVRSGQLVDETAVRDMALAADVLERLRKMVSDYAMDDLARESQRLGLE